MHYLRWLNHGDPLYVAPAEAPPGFKVCRTCEEVKPIEAFASKPYGDGKQTRASNCKDCQRQWMADYRREHGEHVNKGARDSYARDSTKKRRSARAFRERHHARLLVEARERYRRTAETNPEIFRACRARRKQRLKAGQLDRFDRMLSVDYRRAIRDDPCFYCGKRRPGDMHDDHFYPLAKGGTDHWWNLVRACGPCNMRKHTRCGTWFLLSSGGTSEPGLAAAVA